MPELSVLMPVFNECKTVERAVEQVLQGDLSDRGVELIIVDDGSTDGTRELLQQAVWPDSVTIVMHDRNRGKGAAVRTALARARGTYSCVYDADLEYQAADIKTLLGPLRDGQQAVFGVRGFQSHSAYSFWYVIGNLGVTFIANLLYNSWVSDIMTCHKVIKTDLWRSLSLRENGFAIEPEIAGRLLRSGVRIYEVPVTYQARSRESGKKLTSVDGLRVVRTLVRCRFDSKGRAAEPWQATDTVPEDVEAVVTS